MKTNLKPGIISRHDGARRGFTLVELLVVISVIAVLTALIIPVAGVVARKQKISRAQAELENIQTALENYKGKYGVYPPGNTNSALADQNQLFYELSGVTGNGATNYFTLDGAHNIKPQTVSQLFGVGGFVNCTKGSDEDAVLARNFLPGLKAGQIATTNVNGDDVCYLVTAVGGPDDSYLKYLNQLGLPGNPFRYLYPGTNNPNSYDLWVDLCINGKTNRVSNWSSQVQIIQ